MPEPMKNMYSRDSLTPLALDIKSVHMQFEADAFLAWILDDTWPGLELKDRVYKISAALGRFLPAEYAKALAIIDQVVMNYGNWLDAFSGFFPTFVELYGQGEENWELSMAALARYTPYASSEMAVRPFIIHHEQRMMRQMYAWAEDEDECVRRLSCEGCRPALPWAPALNSFKKDPTPVLPILARLKTDPSLHVRKSVANNLNDISKTHPELVASLAREWYGQHAYTDWIVKHGCRTLLKKGNRDVLAIFGYGDAAGVEVQGFSLGATELSIGEAAIFSFEIGVRAPTKLRLEYGIDYVKANGKRNRKIFQISELSLKENGKRAYKKTHSFADASTRKHYPGPHTITLIVNGTERAALDFTLLGPEQPAQ